MEKIDRKEYREYLVNSLNEIHKMTETIIKTENALKLLELNNNLMAELYRLDNEII